MNLNNLQNIYFLGIGGIGMSALARYFHTNGIFVSGYDKIPTELTQKLIEEGIEIHYNENIDLIKKINIELVVYTPAIPPSNEELKYFRENNIMIKKRSEILGMICNEKFLIAVAGTHGKTSISSIITHILKCADKKITAFVGGISKNYNSNFVNDKNSEIVIAEADEFDRSFLTLNPDIAIISSVDDDHLDIYGSGEKLKESFVLFSGNIKNAGKLIINKNIQQIFSHKKDKLLYSSNEIVNYFALNINIKNGKYIFDLSLENNIIREIEFKIPGIHNIENAVAASAVAHLLGVETCFIKKALESYKGVKRRFDIKINRDDFVFIDDYAHHPEELKSTIGTTKELFPDKKICGIFQPHLYSRTRDFADDFARSLELLDEIILLDIYPAREKPIHGVDSKMLLDKINSENKILCNKNELIKELMKRKIEVLLTLGAGDIDKLVQSIKDEYEKSI
ncbi:MAG: UDP-N-acetylmuramate--L-alanine ligase [Bacteroidales bacterium]|nr:UDP-N-acetylmuramate--L-alanine ligase [Bacteroidales bacterium]